jgi:transcriptional antiterminator NusG
MFTQEIEPDTASAAENDSDVSSVAQPASEDDAAEEALAGAEEALAGAEEAPAGAEETPVSAEEALPGDEEALAGAEEVLAGAEEALPGDEETPVSAADAPAWDADTFSDALEDTETVQAIAELEGIAEETEVEETLAEDVDDVGEQAASRSETAIPQDDRAWYVIHCYSGYENKVKHNLEQRIETMQMQDQIFQVVVPTEDEMEVRDGKRRVVERRVFPGYILVQMILTDDSWYVVRNTPGVTGFVGMGNDPTPLRPEEVQAIMKRMEAAAPKIKVTFKPGQKVRIIDGPFNEFIGMVDEIDMERAKVRVLVSFFGRETPVELDFLQVEKT